MEGTGAAKPRRGEAGPDVGDDGIVSIASADSDAVARALEILKGLTAEPEVGTVYKGPVKRVTEFGAFVEILPNIDGLVHISELAHHRVERVEDEVHEGDIVDVKVISMERDGKIRLSRRELLPLPEGEEGDRAKERMDQAREGGPPPRRDGPPRGGDRGGRGGPPRRR